MRIARNPFAGRGLAPRRWLPMLLILLLLPAGFAVRDARASVAISAAGSSGAVDIGFFYSDLQPYGRWVDEPNYGTCWVPSGVAADWRPYWDGHWVYTDFGWTWVSDEPWGWAVYHYGRWFDDPEYGWVWVPGNTWGPAWVDWRWSDECVGWAPLPPEAGWGAWGGLSFTAANRIPSRGWCFVEPRAFVSVDLRSRVFPVARNEMFFRRTRDITRISVHDGRPMNQGVALATIEQRSGQRVDRLRIVDVSSAARGRGQFRNRESIGFFRPAVHGGRMPERGAMPQGRGAAWRGNEPGHGQQQGQVQNPGRWQRRPQPPQPTAQNRWQPQSNHSRGQPAQPTERQNRWQPAQRQDRWQQAQPTQGRDRGQPAQNQPRGQQAQNQPRWQRAQPPGQPGRQGMQRPVLPTEPNLTQRHGDRAGRAPEARPQPQPQGKEKDKGRGDRG